MAKMRAPPNCSTMVVIVSGIVVMVLSGLRSGGVRQDAELVGLAGEGAQLAAADEVEQLARVGSAVDDRAAGDRADHAVLAAGVPDAVAERAAILGASRGHDEVESEERVALHRASGIGGDLRGVRHGSLRATRSEERRVGKE